LLRGASKMPGRTEDPVKRNVLPRKFLCLSR
jgi:hypothetical protein